MEVKGGCHHSEVSPPVTVGPCQEDSPSQEKASNTRNTSTKTLSASNPTRPTLTQSQCTRSLDPSPVRICGENPAMTLDMR